MKNKIKILLLLLAASVLVACGGGKKSEPSKEEAQPQTKQETEVQEETEPETEEITLPEDPVEMLLQDMAGSITPDERLNASAKLFNAIMLTTDISFTEGASSNQYVTVTYPDVASVLREKVAELAADAPQEVVDAMLDEITLAVENGTVPTVKYEAKITMSADENGNYQIEYTEELVQAMTGGLYGATE